MMHIILEGISSTSAFVDDLACASKKRSDHLDDLAEMLTRVELANISLKLVKCEWYLGPGDRLGYLGHEVIPGEGIHVDRKKVEALAAVQPCTTNDHIASFLGAVIFYAKFIPDFSSLAAPLRQLARKYRSKWFGCIVVQKCWETNVLDAFVYKNENLRCPSFLYENV